MHLVKMTMKWPSSMISRGPKMFRYKIHWKLTIKNYITKRQNYNSVCLSNYYVLTFHRISTLSKIFNKYYTII